MARRKKPVITGTDPAYSHQFEAAPSDMPPQVRIPKAEDAAAPAEPPIADAPTVEAQEEVETLDAPEPIPAPEPTGTTETEPAEEKGRGATTPKSEKPKRASAAPKRKPRAPKPAKAAETAPPPLRQAPKRAGQGAPTRRARIRAAITVEQAERMEPLITHGLPLKDIVILAGRRATARYEPSSEFVPMAEAEREPMRDSSYETSKHVDAALLDDLHERHDPLGLKTDGALLRGQFEAVFWSELDAVIEELTGRFLQ